MNKILLFAIILSQTCFSQSAGSGVTDADGNQYNTLIYGQQEVMKENLKTTKYCNGETIPNVNNPVQWEALTTGAWVYYNNDSTNNDPYGKLYNWFTVADDKNVCPCEWHVPTEDEWTTLREFLGPAGTGGNVGGKMKEAGFAHWQSPNYCATNESNFTGLPGGERLLFGDFVNMGKFGDFWTSTSYDNENAFKRDLGYTSAVFSGSTTLTKRFGISIRCMKNTALNIDENQRSGVRVYPNPSSGKLFVTVSEQTNSKPYFIADVTGKLLLQGQLETGENSVDISMLSNGVYFLNIIGEKSVKIMKQ